MELAPWSELHTAFAATIFSAPRTEVAHMVEELIEGRV